VSFEFCLSYGYEIDMMTASFAKTRGQNTCLADFTDSSNVIWIPELEFSILDMLYPGWISGSLAFLSRYREPENGYLEMGSQSSI
jgi:hypothetical protein